MTDEPPIHDLEQLVITACRMVAKGGHIGAMTIVANRRLTYRELARMRNHPMHASVTIAMDGTGTIRVRRRETTLRQALGTPRTGENGHGSRASATADAC